MSKAIEAVIRVNGFRPLDGESISKLSTIKDYDIILMSFPSPRRGINF